MDVPRPCWDLVTPILPPHVPMSTPTQPPSHLTGSLPSIKRQVGTKYLHASVPTYTYRPMQPHVPRYPGTIHTRVPHLLARPGPGLCCRHHHSTSFTSGRYPQTKTATGQRGLVPREGWGAVRRRRLPFPPSGQSHARASSTLSNPSDGRFPGLFVACHPHQTLSTTAKLLPVHSYTRTTVLRSQVLKGHGPSMVVHGPKGPAER